MELRAVLSAHVLLNMPKTMISHNENDGLLSVQELKSCFFNHLLRATHLLTAS